MTDQFAEPFIQAGQDVLAMFTGSVPEQADLAKREMLFTTKEVSIILGISGDICGQVIYGMSETTAIDLASAMMGNEETKFDEMVASAICELGNIISGNAMTLLEQTGHHCNLTPPAIVRGVNVQLATQIPAVVVPLLTQHGAVDVNLALRNK